MSTVHVYTAVAQPATRWETNLDHPVMAHGVIVRWRRWRPVTTNPRNRLLWTTCCRRRRPAKNLLVQAYYEGPRVFCRPETGCKRPSRRRRVTRRVLARAFESGTSMLALARRYGQPVKEIERRLRKGAR